MYRLLLRSLDPRPFALYVHVPPRPDQLTRRRAWSLSLSWSVYSSRYYRFGQRSHDILYPPLRYLPPPQLHTLAIATATALIHKQQTALRGNNQRAIIRISQSKCCRQQQQHQQRVCTMPANNNISTNRSSTISSSRNKSHNKRSNSSLDVNGPPQPASLSSSITTFSSSASQHSTAHANAEPVFELEPEPAQKKPRRSARVVLLQQKQDLNSISSSSLSPRCCTPIEQSNPVGTEGAAAGAPPLPSSSQMSSRRARAVTSTASPPLSSSSTIANLTLSTSRSTCSSNKRQANKAVTATTTTAASTPKANYPSPITTAATAPTKSNSNPNAPPSLSPSNSSPSYWLMKSEPESRIEKGKDVKFSIDDLAACKEPAAWDGVRNYAARNNLLAMKKGDLAFFYHSNCKHPGITGIMEIVEPASIDETAFLPASPYYDPKSTNREKPKWFIVKVQFVEKFSKLIGLAELKGYSSGGNGGGGDIEKVLVDMQLFKMSRLSVSKVSKEEWRFILGLVGDRKEEGK